MINDVEIISLKVEEVNPHNNSINIDLATDIRIKFNSNIAKSTVVNNILLFLVDNGKEERIPCNIMVKDNVVILTPKELLSVESNYKIFIAKNGVSDILGRRCIIDFSYNFTTMKDDFSSKPIILEPTDSKIYSSNPSIKFVSNTESNIIEISKDKSFTSVVYEKLYTKAYDVEQNYLIETSLGEGLYYVRIKNENNVYSDVSQFYISIVDGKVSEEDFSKEVESFDLFNDVEFIKASQSDKIVKNNFDTIDFVFEGKLDPSVLDSCNHYLYGNSLKDEYDEDYNPHGYMDYDLTYVYDDVEDKTYIIFNSIKAKDVSNNPGNHTNCLTNDDLMTDAELKYILDEILNNPNSLVNRRLRE